MPRIAIPSAEPSWRVVLVMPEHLSIERRQSMAAYGAQIVLTPQSGGMEMARRHEAVTAIVAGTAHHPDSLGMGRQRPSQPRNGPAGSLHQRGRWLGGARA